MTALAFVTTRSGKRYHRPDCLEVDAHKATNGRLLRTLEQVRRDQLEPCKVCRPSGYGLTLVS